MNDIDLQALTAPKKARLEIIPLIDVIFFLLATFVLFTLSLSKLSSIETEFPQPSDQVSEIDETVYLQASLAGTYYWKQGRNRAPELVNANELAPRLAEYRRSTPQPRVLIRGDDKAKFGAAIDALDEVRKSGIRKVSVETVVGLTGM